MQLILLCSSLAFADFDHHHCHHHCCAPQGVHNQWADPSCFRPERFLPDGEYEQFDEAVRPYMFVPFIQVSARFRPFAVS
jgi:hypothetical protein